MTVRFVAATPDPVLQGAAEAATLHFQEVGVSEETVQTFLETAKEAGISVDWEGKPGVFSLDFSSP